MQAVGILDVPERLKNTFGIGCFWKPYLMKSLVSLILKSSPCNLSYSSSWKLPCLEGSLNGICDWLQSMNRPVYKCSFIKILPFPNILLNNSNDDFPVALFVFLFISLRRWPRIVYLIFPIFFVYVSYHLTVVLLISERVVWVSGTVRNHSERQCQLIFLDSNVMVQHLTKVGLSSWTFRPWKWRFI